MFPEFSSLMANSQKVSPLSANELLVCKQKQKFKNMRTILCDSWRMANFANSSLILRNFQIFINISMLGNWRTKMEKISCLQTTRRLENIPRASGTSNGSLPGNGEPINRGKFPIPENSTYVEICAN